ncbi:MAG: SpoIID/LytB domain-containing protein, partial [Endomicrobium sp.]|nr:SpoIID/LytB domain-containing protein [Endomicrobium sp.]
KGVQINKHILSLPIKIEPSDGIIFANAKPYRGYLILKKSGDKINVINVLLIEDYIKGVLPKEVSCDWPIETLKVQAVISRTYSIANLNKHSAQGFNMCSTTHCQVYGGAGVETASCNKAVLLTQYEILTFGGQFAQTVFHANCGGHTEDPQYVWNWENTPSYLRGVKCGYCKKMPNTNWEKSLDERFIREKLSKNNIGKIKKIKVKEKTPIGCAKNLKIVHSKGKLLLNAYQFRLAVDAWQIKSHFFDSIKKDGNKFHFKGRGWGHKVGLCQCGAKVMGEKGKDYKDILFHFYPGTILEKVTYK